MPTLMAVEAKKGWHTINPPTKVRSAQCPCCGEVFRKRTSRQKYCSRRCANRSAKRAKNRGIRREILVSQMPPQTFEWALEAASKLDLGAQLEFARMARWNPQAAVRYVQFVLAWGSYDANKN